MEVPDSVAELNKAETRSESFVEGSVNEIGNSWFDSVQGMNGLEKSMSVKADCSGFDEHLSSRDVIGGGNSLKKADGMKDYSVDSSMMKEDLGSTELAEIDCGDTNTSRGDESYIGVLGDNSFHKIESLDCSIEEGLEKVTLVGDGGGLVERGLEKVNLVGDEGGLNVTDSGMKKVGTPVVNENSDNDSDSESNCKTSSSSLSTSSSASSSSSESDDDEQVEVKEKKNLCKISRESSKQTMDLEEGQIIDSDAENMVSWSANTEKEEDDDDNSIENSEEFQFEDDAIADEDEDTVKGPIKSKNELTALPPVPQVNVTLLPCHQILPVGVVSSVLGAQVIVEGSEKHNPLNEGSILWIADRRLPLGIVDEIFGPVKTPYYIVRYNSESEVPSGIQNGTSVGFVLEFVGHVLNEKNLYQKGYDASGENDEEVLDELDFSDDEKEAEYKRMLKMSKRGNNNQVQGPGNKKKNNRSRGKTWTKDQPSTSQSPTVQSSQPRQVQQQMSGMSPLVSSSNEGNHFGPSSTGPVFSGGPAVPSLSQGYQLGASPMGPFFHRGPTTFPQQGFLLNGLFANMAFPSGFQMNGMPLLQQNHPQNLQVASALPIPWQQQQHVSQMPLTNTAPCQQPFDLSQLVAGNSAAPLGPINFPPGPSNVPWVGMFGQNLSNQAPPNVGLVAQNLTNQAPGLQGSRYQLPTLQGLNCNSQPPTSFRGNEQASQFSQGFSSGRGGRGRGRKPFHRRGGRFGG